MMKKMQRSLLAVRSLSGVAIVGGMLFGSIEIASADEVEGALPPVVTSAAPNAAAIPIRQRVQLDLNMGAEVQLTQGLDVFFGPGLACVLDTIETTTVSDTGTLQAAQTSRARARPVIDFGLADGAFFARDVFTLSSPPEVRVDMGIMLGQRNFRHF